MSDSKHGFRVAAVQTAPVFLNKDATIDRVCELTQEAGNVGTSLVVFPEAFVSGYPDWVWVLPPAQKPLINELYKGTA